MEEKLKEFYYNPETGFNNLNSFYKKLKENKINYSFRDVKNWYDSQNIISGAPLKKKYQNSDLLLVDKFENSNLGNKSKEMTEINEHEEKKRKNKKTGLDVDAETGDIVMPKNMIPKREKREVKKPQRYGFDTK